MSQFSDETKLEFTLPKVITDFVFDLHEAMCRSLIVEELNHLYENTHKEITDQYFPQSAWPDSSSIAHECENNEGFLLIYREMAMRHATTKLKPQLGDHIDSWHNYVKLFDFVLTVNERDFTLTTQWIYDIIQEFVYQFQGFCQYRCQVATISNNPETINILESNREVWNLPVVVSILQKLIQAGKLKGKLNKVTANSPFIVQFGYFASIELARLECLTGDFNSSLSALSTIKLYDRSELFTHLPLCHFNVFYHTGVSYLMLRNFTSAIEVFSEIILHVSRILKPGASGSLRAGLTQQLTRMLDKALALTAIASFLNPNNNLDEQVKEAVESKFLEKIQKMKNIENNPKTFAELFDFNAPKFISPFVPDYSVHVNMRQDASNHISSVFITEVEQHHNFHKLRSFLGLYATIDVAKMARFNDTTEINLISQLLSYKTKSITNNSQNIRINNSDVHYYIDNGALFIDNSSSRNDQKKSQERFFVAGIRKHAQIVDQINRVFNGLDL